jgi:hypothetical protein
MFYAKESWYTTSGMRGVRNGEEPEDVIVFLTVPSAMDPSIAPPGKECVVARTICSPDPEAPEIPMLNRKLDEMMERIFRASWTRSSIGPPTVRPRCRRARATRSCRARVASASRACSSVGPTPAVRGCGTHQVGDSGLRVAAMVRDATKVRRGGT